MLLFPSLCRSYFMGRLREAKSWPVILLKRDSNTYAFLWYCSIFINSFFIDLWWYSEKWLQNFKDNSISVDMKVYVLQLNSKSQLLSIECCKILVQLLLRIILEAASKKKIKKEEKMQSDPFGFRFSLFLGQLFIKSWSNLLSPQIFTQWSLSVWIVIHFCKPKKGVISPVFPIKILVAEAFIWY